MSQAQSQQISDRLVSRHFVSAAVQSGKSDE